MLSSEQSSLYWQTCQLGSRHVELEAIGPVSNESSANSIKLERASPGRATWLPDIPTFPHQTGHVDRRGHDAVGVAALENVHGETHRQAILFS